MKAYLRYACMAAAFLLSFAMVQGQNCPGPFTTNTLTVSNAYTLGNGNTGVAIFFKNSNYSWTPANLTSLSFDVDLTGCSPYINSVILTSFNNSGATTTISNNNRTATFSFSNNTFQLVDNEVVMILELASCSGSGAVDVDISNISMEFSNIPVAASDCDGEGVISSCSSCNTSGRHITVLGPYTGYTGNPFVAFIYNSPTNPDNMTGIYLKAYFSGDVTVLNAWNSVLPGSPSVSYDSKNATLFWTGSFPSAYTGDPMLIVELDDDPCGNVNFCTKFLRIGSSTVPMDACNASICTSKQIQEADFAISSTNYVTELQAPADWAVSTTLEGVTAFPNPFVTGTTLSFELPEASNVTLTLTNHLGQVLRSSQQDYSAGQHAVEVDGSDLAAGIYYYQVRTESGNYTGRVVKN